MEGDAIGVRITRKDGVWFVPWAQVTTARVHVDGVESAIPPQEPAASAVDGLMDAMTELRAADTSDLPQSVAWTDEMIRKAPRRKR